MPSAPKAKAQKTHRPDAWHGSLARFPPREGGGFYDFVIADGALWLVPKDREPGPIRFSDPLALIRQFDFVPLN